ncbi:low-density lipoprotein receptor-related protein 5-like [Amphiura filiformis]|uniref:low-density lipoprotein receptor-related protein 5-like n=1 Tax=Amphiura filiformis TaxID=82378 RepID=UPI003B21DBC7
MDNIVTEEEDKKEEEIKIRTALTAECGYPKRPLERVKQQMKDKQLKARQKKKDDVPSKRMVVIPYVEDDFIIVADLANHTIWTGPVVHDAQLELTEIPTIDLFRPTAVDYDPVDGKLYWTDITRDTINRANLDGSNEEVLFYFLTTPEGLAIDSVHRVMYWVDSGPAIIEKANLDGTGRTTIINTDIEKPRAIVVDPTAGFIYWTDWGNHSKIERAKLDGSERYVFVDTELIRPSGLALDFEAQRLYWCDAGMDRVETVDFTGGNRKNLFEGYIFNMNSFDLAISGNYIYWTDWAYLNILRMDKYAGLISLEAATPPLLAQGGGIHIANIPPPTSTSRPTTPSPPTTTTRPIQTGIVTDVKTTAASPSTSTTRKPYTTSSNVQGPAIFIDDFIIVADLANHTIWTGSVVHDAPLELTEIPTIDFFRPTAVDYDPVDRKLYWTDITRGTINRANLDGTNEEVLFSFLSIPEGLAIDSVHRVMYWVDSGPAIIEKANLNGTGHDFIIVADLANHTIWTGSVVHDAPLELTEIPTIDFFRPTAVDYDPVDRKLYWTDITRGTINRANLDGTNEEVLFSFLSIPEGLAIDSVHRVMYWVDSGPAIIEKANLNGTGRTTIINTDIERPRAIVVDSTAGFIYWTDWGNHSKIERAKLDGSERYVFVDTELNRPSGLALDFEGKRLYWCDAGMQRIETVDFNGGSRLNLFHGYNFTMNSFDLAISGNDIYWTDWAYLNILRMDKYAGLTSLEAATPPLLAQGGGVHIDDVIIVTDMANRTIWTGRAGNNPPLEFTEIPTIEFGRPIAVDYDPVDGKLYWTDVLKANGSVCRANLDGSNEEVLFSSLHIPEGLAIDSVHRVMYWIDSGLDIIEKANLDGTGRTTIINTNIEKPRAIVVDPTAGFIYWTDWGNHSKIERAKLDGSERYIFVDTELLGPSGLAFDFEDQRLYWCDNGMQRVETVDFNGGNRVNLFQGYEFATSAYDLAISGKYIYWSDWTYVNLIRMDKYAGVVSVEAATGALLARGGGIHIVNIPPPTTNRPTRPSPPATTTRLMQTDIKTDVKATPSMPSTSTTRKPTTTSTTEQGPATLGTY